MGEREVPEGYRLEWVPDPNWRMGGDGYKCRQKPCQNLAVAAMRRKHSGRNQFDNFRWWRYCEDHLYGRKVEDGIVKFERLVPVEPQPPSTIG